jgi:hypothetical protein
MTEPEARRHLRDMLESFTPGSILHLLSELFAESAEQARQQGDEGTEEQHRHVEATLFVVGLGIDAACPR